MSRTSLRVWMWMAPCLAVVACFDPADPGDDIDSELDLGEETQELVAGEPLLGLVSSAYGPDVNRYVPNLEQQVRELKDHGDYYGYYTGSGPSTTCTLTDCQEHWQGIARLTYPTAARDHLIAVSSDDAASFLSVIPTRAAAGLRLRGNQLSPTTQDWNARPNSGQTIRHSEIIESCTASSCRNHPGGMQTLGQYVVVGVERIASTELGKVFLYDAGALSSTNRDPRKVWEITLAYSDGAAFAAAAKLKPLAGETTSRYLLVTAGNDSKTLMFNLSRLGEPLTSAYAFSSTYQITQPEGTLTPSQEFPTSWAKKYQSMQLLTAPDGQLYLLGANRSGSPTAGYVDFIDLFRLDVTLTGSMGVEAPLVTARVTRAAHKEMTCEPTIASGANARQGCDFSAATGVYIDPRGRPYFYATVHDDRPLNGGTAEWTRMMEFRPWNHVDDPGTSGQETCASLANAWVNLYDGTLTTNPHGTRMPLRLNSFMIDYVDRWERDGGSFGTAYNFNDRVRSLHYCLPSGYKFRLFQHDDFGGSWYDLPGYGTVKPKEWTSTQGWSSGCFMPSAGTSAADCL